MFLGMGMSMHHVYHPSRKERVVAASELVTRITSESVEAVMAEAQPVLIGCLVQNDHLELNLACLELAALFFQDEVAVYYALEEMHPYFRKGFGLSGTPTFIVVLKGTPLGTLLGRFPPGELIEHVSHNLSSRHRHTVSGVRPRRKMQRAH